MILPPLSIVLLSFTLLLACYILTRRLLNGKVKVLIGLVLGKRKNDILDNNKKIVYESESFLKS